MQKPLPRAKPEDVVDWSVTESEDGYWEFWCKDRLAGTIEVDPSGRLLFRSEYALGLEHISYIRGAMLGILGIEV